MDKVSLKPSEILGYIIYAIQIGNASAVLPLAKDLKEHFEKLEKEENEQ